MDTTSCRTKNIIKNNAAYSTDIIINFFLLIYFSTGGSGSGSGSLLIIIINFILHTLTWVGPSLVPIIITKLTAQYILSPPTWNTWMYTFHHSSDYRLLFNFFDFKRVYFLNLLQITFWMRILPFQIIKYRDNKIWCVYWYFTNYFEIFYFLFD